MNWLELFIAVRKIHAFYHNSQSNQSDDNEKDQGQKNGRKVEEIFEKSFRNYITKYKFYER